MADKLSDNWITEGHIDFEYKKYILLAYLQTAEKYFGEKKIYPFLHDLLFHYRNLTSIKNNTEKTERSFPKSISKLDLQNFTLQYEKMVSDNLYLDEIKNIIDFAIPQIIKQIDTGKEIYELVEHSIRINTVGIIPFYKNEGYLFLKSRLINDTSVYYYELSLIENKDEKFQAMKTVFIDYYPPALYNYEEAIKADLIKKNKQLPHPATYVISSKQEFPFPETFFPVAKRCFMKYLSAQA